MKHWKSKVALTAAVALLAGCGGPGEPNDAAGLKVMRTLLERAHVQADILSFKKTMGRAAKTAGGEVYEYWYETKVRFPQDLEIKCAQQKERGVCSLLGILDDREIKKNEVIESEGSLHFAKAEKGWVGEDDNAY